MAVMILAAGEPKAVKSLNMWPDAVGSEARADPKIKYQGQREFKLI